MVTLTNAENVLKTVYLDAITEQLNTGVSPFFSKVIKTANDVYGGEIRKMVTYGINGGIGATSETGTLPKASSANRAEFVLPLKNLYGTIELSDKAIRASEHSNAAFVSLLEAEINSLLTSAKYNFCRMLMGDAKGTLATVKSQTGTSIVVDSTRCVMEGMLVDVISLNTNATLATGLKITDVDRVNNKITVSGTINSAGFTAGDFLIMQGSYNKELSGLAHICSTTSSLYGVNRSQNKWIKPFVTQSEDISEVIIQKSIDRVADTHGSQVDMIVCSNGVKRAYQDYLITNKANVDYVDLDGLKAISVGGIPMVADRFCNEGRMYLLDTSDFGLHQLCDWRWIEGDSGNVLRQMGNQPVYSATLVKYAELMCYRPGGQAVIDGITEA